MSAGAPRERTTRRMVLAFLALLAAVVAVALAVALSRSNGRQHEVRHFPRELEKVEIGMRGSELRDALGDPGRRLSLGERTECWIYELPAPREYRFCFQGDELVSRSTH